MVKPIQQPALWCLKAPDGTLLYTTLTNPATAWVSFDAKGKKRPIDAVWGRGGYEAVAEREGEAWAKVYYRKWDESIAAAKRLGYIFVRVKLTEVTSTIR